MVALTPVTSGNIASIGWDSATQTLQVLFKSGALYAYSGVPRSTFEAFLSAPSKGAYFAKVVKDQFPTRRVR